MTPPEPKPRVLVVDDNADAADTLAALLTIHDYTVSVAYSGTEALALGDAFHPQCVILDIAMPAMDGCETALRMRQRPWGRQAMIGALTARGDDDTRSRAVQAGMEFYFTKPVKAETLLAVLEHVRA
jgi:CheY-like chemotaxis protein